MKTPHTMHERLRATITALEEKQKLEMTVLRGQAQTTFDSIKPINLITSTLNDVAGSQSLKDHLISTGVGLVVGRISERLIEGHAPTVMRKLLGTAVLFGVTNLVARNPQAVIKVGGSVLGLLRKVMAAMPKKNHANK